MISTMKGIVALLAIVVVVSARPQLKKENLMSIADQSGTTSLTIDFNTGWAMVRNVGSKDCYFFDSRALKDLNMLRKDLKSPSFEVYINTEKARSMPKVDSRGVCSTGRIVSMPTTRTISPSSELAKRSSLSVCVGSTIVICSSDPTGDLRAAVNGLKEPLSNGGLDDVLLDVVSNVGQGILDDLTNVANDIGDAFNSLFG